MHRSNPTTQAYAELSLAYAIFNARLFNGALPTCLITLQREKRSYGYFSSQRFESGQGEVTDEIALNPEFFGAVPVLETLQTLVHEMCHLWQFHFGTPGRGRYHNEEWASKMEAIGLMPSSTGHPGGRRTGDHMSDYVLPGGRFEQAVAHLVSEKGFTLTWYDCSPTSPPRYRTTSAAAVQQLPGGVLSPPTPDAKPLLSRPQVSVNRSNRTKYTCAACGANAWGKPDLRLSCIPCGLPLSSHPANASGPSWAPPLSTPKPIL